MSLLSPGTIIADRYEVVELLGMGGHGAVYRALQRPLGREVALKTILVEALAGDGALERFTREAKVVQGLEHPNTVRLFDFGVTAAGMPFSVFELLRGVTLEHEIRRGPLAPDRVGRIAAQVLRSLVEAHAKGIVHRDIKPSNVLLLNSFGERDFVKLLDFGVAKQIVAPAPSHAITQTGQIIGTPAYMAPEQVHGDGIGPASDLYSLGLVMAESLSGRAVYDDHSPIRVWVEQTSLRPVPLLPSVKSSAFGAVISRATQKAPAARYPSAAAMLEAVDLASTNLASFAEAPTSPPAVPSQVSTAPLRAPLRLEPPAPPVGTRPLVGHERASYDQPRDLTALVTAHVRGPSVPHRHLPSSPSPTQGSSPRLLLVLSVGGLAIAILVLVAGTGAAWLATRREQPAGEGPSPTVPSSLASTSSPSAATGTLRHVDANRVEQRLGAAGWTIRSRQVDDGVGFRILTVGASKKFMYAGVRLYDFESPQLRR